VNAQAHSPSQALVDCSSEQLHLSGRIQAHGALIAADLEDRRVTYASANTPELIGAAPDQLFDSSVMSIFSPDEQQRFEQAIEETGQPPSSHDLYGVRLAAFDGKDDVILHQVDAQIVVEIERAYGDDQANLLPVLYASEAIGEAKSVPEVEAAVASAVRALTGFDRAMVYQFHEDGHGEIVAEDRLPGLVRYLGHHFPASDIPLQARQLYTRKASRYIPDSDEGDVPVIASPRMAGTGLDLSHASLRSVSPYHLEYMRNMKTAASVSFPMVEEGRLTRLVSCTSEYPQRLSRSKCRSCEVVVLQAKLQASAAEQIYRLNDAASREAIRSRLRAAMRNAPGIAEGLTSAPGDLLELCQADGAAACADGQYRSIGAAPSEDAVRRLAGEIRAARSPVTHWATDRLEQPTADALGVAGCLFVVLPAPDDFVI
jgi:chemotaxis family two-component system sensor kinase Cph1